MAKCGVIRGGIYSADLTPAVWKEEDILDLSCIFPDFQWLAQKREGEDERESSHETEGCVIVSGTGWPKCTAILAFE